MPPSERHSRALKARQTRRDLTKIHRDDGTTLQQLQSPLFSKLPVELRLLIYEFALSGYFHKPLRWFSILSTSLPESLLLIHSCLHHLYPLRTATQLLHTCRRVYCEANNIPMRFAKFKVIGCLDEETIRDGYWCGSPPAYFANFTHKNSAEMQDVEFFADAALRQEDYFRFPQFQPKVITLNCTLSWGLMEKDLPPLPSSCCRLNLVEEMDKSEEQAFRRDIEDIAPRRIRSSDDRFELSRDGNEMISTSYRGLKSLCSAWSVREMPSDLLNYCHRRLGLSTPLEWKDWCIITLVYTRRKIVDG